MIEKLKIFKIELIKRDKIANQYNKIFTILKTPIQLPKLVRKVTSNWAQYTVVLPKKVDRNLLKKCLMNKHIPTAIYYPIPLHKQKPYNNFPITDDLKNTNFLSKTVISLPMHPYLKSDQIKYICENFHNILNNLIK